MLGVDASHATSCPLSSATAHRYVLSFANELVLFWLMYNTRSPPASLVTDMIYSRIQGVIETGPRYVTLSTVHLMLQGLLIVLDFALDLISL